MLNPTLYMKMALRYGEVRVVKPDNAGVPPHIFTDPYSHRKFARWLDGDDKGEEYQTCCPFCNDRGFHLYVNHHFGEVDSYGNYIKIAKCFKGCLDEPKNLKKLFQDLVLDLHKPSQEEIRKILSRPVKVGRSLPVSLFGVTPLTSLPEQHPAVQYLYERGYGMETAQVYQLGYCSEDNPEFMVRNRLIIPVFYQGQQVGWQARKINDDAMGAKYFNSAGFSKSNFLYNYDIARHQPFVVIVEGVTDVWRIGAPAVSGFGKCLSDKQLRLLTNTWQGKPLLVMLDKDAEKESLQTFDKLRSFHDGPVEFIRLPDGFKDPDKIPPDILRGIIEETLQHEANTRRCT